MDEMVTYGKEATQTRCERTMESSWFDQIRKTKLLETSAEHFLTILPEHSDPSQSHISEKSTDRRLRHPPAHQQRATRFKTSKKTRLGFDSPEQSGERCYQCSEEGLPQAVPTVLYPR